MAEKNVYCKQEERRVTECMEEITIINIGSVKKNDRRGEMRD